jgi:serine/threonine protein phosphatase PrpC
MTSFFNALRRLVGAPASAAPALPALPTRPAASQVLPVATLRVRGAAFTDTGPVRTSNEDRVCCMVEEAGALGERVSLVVVADGMGGHQAGEIASQTTVEVVTAEWRQRGAADAGRVLDAAIRRAAAEVFAAASRKREWEGMGTTVVALAVDGDRAIVGHVGDSRAYLWRAGELRQLSEDDTLVNHLLRTGVITAAQMHDHPDRGVLSQALGTRAMAPDVHISAPLAMCAGDLFLLCSDGLHDVLTDSVLARLLGEPGAADDLGATALRLAQAAIAAGTRDNVSVALLAVLEAAPATLDEPLRPTRPVNVSVSAG